MEHKRCSFLRNIFSMGLVAVGAGTAKSVLAGTQQHHAGARYIPGGFDPLAQYWDKPIISPPLPGGRFLGRVIVELFDHQGHPDSWNIAIRSDGVGIGNQQLLVRVSKALAARLRGRNSG